MTSQEKIENEALIEQAKALKIGNWWTCSPEKLQEKVNLAMEADVGTIEQPTVAKPTEEARKVAPRMKVYNRNEDSRERLAREYRQAEPENEFVFQHGDITDKALEAKGLQRTGEQVGGDILCRTNKESFGEWMKAENEASLDVVRAIEKDNEGGKLVRRMTEARVK